MGPQLWYALLISLSASNSGAILLRESSMDGASESNQ